MTSSIDFIPQEKENAYNKVEEGWESVWQSGDGVVKMTDEFINALKALKETPDESAPQIIETATQAAFQIMRDCHLTNPIRRAIEMLEKRAKLMNIEEARKAQNVLKAVLATSIFASTYLIDQKKSVPDIRKTSWASTDTCISSNTSTNGVEEDISISKLSIESFDDNKSSPRYSMPVDSQKPTHVDLPTYSQSIDPNDFQLLYANSFILGKEFLTMCLAAQTKACSFPEVPPPALARTVESTTMHLWYFVLLEEFTQVFRRKLKAEEKSNRKGNTQSAMLNRMTESMDEESFQMERDAHCRSILNCYKQSWGLGQDPDTYTSIVVDNKQPNHEIARLAALEARSKADFPGKRNWKTGDPLHPEYHRKFKLFDAALMDIITANKEHGWLADVPQAISRGASTFKENWMRDIRVEFERKWAVLKKYEQQRSTGSNKLCF